MELTLLLEATAKLRLRKMTVIRLICYPGSPCTRKYFVLLCAVLLKRCKCNWLFGTLFLLTSREKNSVIFNKFHQKFDLNKLYINIILFYAFFILKALFEFSLFVQVVSYSSRLSIESQFFSIHQQIREAGAVRLTIYWLFHPIYQLL